MTRTFIALEMNSDVQRHLTDVIRRVARVLPDVRWVDPANIHLTLAFLGELSDEQLMSAQDATREAALQSHRFSYQLSRLGIFGPPRQPRVIWMGIEEPKGLLQRVHQTLSCELRRRDFELETRPFAPHFTLARVKAPLTVEEQGRFRALLEGKQQGIMTTQHFLTSHLVVMKSELSRSGAQYTQIEKWSLISVSSSGS
jgi:2'-5' RNA ligase